MEAKIRQVSCRTEFDIMHTGFAIVRYGRDCLEYDRVVEPILTQHLRQFTRNYYSLTQGRNISLRAMETEGPAVISLSPRALHRTRNRI
jgi:hypothetical protein